MAVRALLFAACLCILPLPQALAEPACPARPILSGSCKIETQPGNAGGLKGPSLPDPYLMGPYGVKDSKNSTLTTGYVRFSKYFIPLPPAPYWNASNIQPFFEETSNDTHNLQEERQEGDDEMVEEGSYSYRNLDLNIEFGFPRDNPAGARYLSWHDLETVLFATKSWVSLWESIESLVPTTYIELLVDNGEICQGWGTLEQAIYFKGIQADEGTPVRVKS
ncbi:MAG: hypothetical protein Q9163_003262 [Psora crenata]